MYSFELLLLLSPLLFAGYRLGVEIALEKSAPCDHLEFKFSKKNAQLPCADKFSVIFEQSGSFLSVLLRSFSSLLQLCCDSVVSL